MWSRHHDMERDLNCGTDSDGRIGRIKAELGELVTFSHSGLRRVHSKMAVVLDRPNGGVVNKNCDPEKTDLVGNMMGLLWDTFWGWDVGRTIKWNFAVRQKCRSGTLGLHIFKQSSANFSVIKIIV